MTYSTTPTLCSKDLIGSLRLYVRVIVPTYILIIPGYYLMTEQDIIEAAPRADTLKMASGDGIHDKWNLHIFAFEQEADWMPVRLKRYHKDRFQYGELMEGYFDEYIPETYDTGRGAILKKEIEEQTTYCPECDVPARRYDGDTMCPECGLLCADKKATDNLVRDPKAAGRMAEE